MAEYLCEEDMNTGEYISRDLALKQLNATCLATDCDNYNGVRCRACAYADAMDFIDAIPAADIQPVNQWISCKDKMPEDNIMVLFVYVSENGIKSVHYGYHQTIKGLGSSWAKPSGGWQYCDDDVTHWLPLPEPPKDGDVE